MSSTKTYNYVKTKDLEDIVHNRKTAIWTDT